LTGRGPTSGCGWHVAGRTGVASPGDGAGRVGVDDEGLMVPPVMEEPVESALNRGDFGVESCLPGAQGLAPLGYDLAGSFVVGGDDRPIV